MPQQNRFRLRRRALSGFVLLGTLALGAIPALAAGGPDVTVFTLGSTTRWGQVGNIIGYSVGTTSCNIGTTPVAWCDAGTCLGGTLQSNDHPVIAQNMYRLKDGRFTQIGMSWLKHGWLSTNSGGSNSGCGVGVCTIPPGGGDQLGVGCTDTYDSSLNGGSGNPGTCDSGSCRLGQRSAVNATTGDFLMPYVNIAHPATIDQRLQVNVNDVDPGLAANIGALYFVEGQYIGGDDGAAGNAFNNASYRPVTIGASPFNLSLAGSTVRLKSALYGWLANDPQPDPDPDPNDGVVITNQDFCVSPVERFEVGRKVTGPIAGVWHYEYAVHNMNSDHSAGSFSVDFPDGTAITNVGFHDVDSHSGEPYATTEWTSAVDAGTGTVSWTSETYATNNNANALRFATMYSFWFDATAPGSSATHSIGLFK
ncbi:MAG: hypothetical protein ABI639_13980, partial [Thermoanaerobaculia bacterium]